jgi:hypothetical protein
MRIEYPSGNSLILAYYLDFQLLPTCLTLPRPYSKPHAFDTFLRTRASKGLRANQVLLIDSVPLIPRLFRALIPT